MDKQEFETIINLMKYIKNNGDEFCKTGQLFFNRKSIPSHWVWQEGYIYTIIFSWSGTPFHFRRDFEINGIVFDCTFFQKKEYNKLFSKIKIIILRFEKNKKLKKEQDEKQKELEQEKQRQFAIKSSIFNNIDSIKIPTKKSRGALSYADSTGGELSFNEHDGKELSKMEE